VLFTYKLPGLIK